MRWLACGVLPGLWTWVYLPPAAETVRTVKSAVLYTIALDPQRSFTPQALTGCDNHRVLPAGAERRQSAGASQAAGANVVRGDGLLSSEKRKWGQNDEVDGVPKGIRTPVIAVKGRCPRPG